MQHKGEYEKINQFPKARQLIQKLSTSRLGRIWYNNKGFHAMPTYLNVMNNAILRANSRNRLKYQTHPELSDVELDLKVSEYGITVTNHPMNQTNNFLNTEYLLQGSVVLISIFTIVAMSFVNASFVLFLVYERSIKSLHLQFLSGLNPLVYWLTNLLWDTANYMLPAACIIVILKIFDVPAYVHGQNYTAVVSLFLMYGWSVSPLMYPLTFVFKEASTAYICLIVLNLFTGITCVESSFLFQMFSFDTELKFVYDSMKTMFLIFPPYCLGRGLIDVALTDYYNNFFLKTGQTDKIRSPFEWDIITRNLFSMFVSGVVAWLLTILIEYEFFKFKWLKKPGPPLASLTLLNPLNEDIDVKKERERINTLVESQLDSDKSTTMQDSLILSGLRKVFYKNPKGLLSMLKEKLKTKQQTKENEFTAVHGLSFGVPKGECFGLLGVNGAGNKKSFYYQL